MAAAPRIYFETDHYKGWPAVLVRLSKIDDRELRHRLERAWRHRAPKGRYRHPTSRRQEGMKTPADEPAGKTSSSPGPGADSVRRLRWYLPISGRGDIGRAQHRDADLDRRGDPPASGTRPEMLKFDLADPGEVTARPSRSRRDATRQHPDQERRTVAAGPDDRARRLRHRRHHGSAVMGTLLFSRGLVPLLRPRAPATSSTSSRLRTAQRAPARRLGGLSCRQARPDWNDRRPAPGAAGPESTGERTLSP